MTDEPYIVTRPQYVRLGAVLLALETARSVPDALRAIHDLKVEEFPASSRLIVAALNLAKSASDSDFPSHPRNIDGDPEIGAGLGDMVCPYCEQSRYEGHDDICPVSLYEDCSSKEKA